MKEQEENTDIVFYFDDEIEKETKTKIEKNDSENEEENWDDSHLKNRIRITRIVKKKKY